MATMKPYIGNGFDFPRVSFRQSGRSAKGQSDDDAERAHGCGAEDASVSRGAVEVVGRRHASRRSRGRG